MEKYRGVYELLDLPESIIRCATGQIPIPLVTVESPSFWYGFPPALIPVCSDASGPMYFGYWKHWFNIREASFVQMYVEAGRLVIEIARTPAQFFCYLAMSALTVHEGISEPLKHFASAVGIHNLEQLDAVSLKTGDDPKGFSALPQFAANLPLNSVKEERYTGNFPSGRFTETSQWWNDACSFEVPEELGRIWPDSISRPRWMLPGKKVDIFNEFLNNGDFHRAWLTLNSTGWMIADARTALRKLSQAANDPKFDVLVSAWRAIADESVGSY